MSLDSLFEDQVEIRYGTLLEPIGRPASHQGYILMGARVELAGSSFSLDFRLRDRPRDDIPPTVRYAVKAGFDAAWVRARIPSVFGFSPPRSEAEKALLDVGFVAVERDALAYPFVCTDHYGKSGLMFSDEGPARSTKEQIASAFWGLLCQDHENLADFEQRILHVGAGVWLTFGCNAGQLYCDESDD